LVGYIFGNFLFRTIFGFIAEKRQIDKEDVIAVLESRLSLELILKQDIVVDRQKLHELSELYEQAIGYKCLTFLKLDSGLRMTFS